LFHVPYTQTASRTPFSSQLHRLPSPYFPRSTIYPRALTVVAHHEFLDAEFIEGDLVLSPHDGLVILLEELDDGQGLLPPHQLPEGTVMMTIAVDNAAALGSDIFLRDSYSMFVRSRAGRVRWKGRLSTTKKTRKLVLIHLSQPCDLVDLFIHHLSLQKPQRLATMQSQLPFSPLFTKSAPSPPTFHAIMP
jgi:hypothetical protein